MRNLSKIFLALAVFAMVGCGENKKDETENVSLDDYNNTEETTTTSNSTTSSDADTAEGATSDTEAAEGDVVELTIEGNDQMQFNKNELRVKAGQTVRLTLKHVGQLEKNVMGHNWVLLQKGTDITQFGQAAVAAASNDYIPQNSDQIIAHTELIGGGQSTTIEFTAPAAGTYDFICSFPGHFAVMQGKFIVE